MRDGAHRRDRPGARPRRPGRLRRPPGQMPPMWSAVKVKGKRLYTYAQGGRRSERGPRGRSRSGRSRRSAIAVPDVRLTVVCSKGTYIRALVDDIGTALGCGAYLTGLQRTRIGAVPVDDAVTIEELVRYARRGGRSSPYERRALGRVGRTRTGIPSSPSGPSTESTARTAEIIGRLIGEARRSGGRSVVVTFDPHPKSVVGTTGEPVRLLTTARGARRDAWRRSASICCWCWRSPGSSRGSRPRSSITTCRGADPGRAACRGRARPHVRAGTRRRGGGARRLGTSPGFTVLTRAPAFVLDGQVVSSTTIRNALADGRCRTGRRVARLPLRACGDGRCGGRAGGDDWDSRRPISAPGTRDKVVPARGVYRRCTPCSAAPGATA